MPLDQLPQSRTCEPTFPPKFLNRGAFFPIVLRGVALPTGTNGKAARNEAGGLDETWIAKSAPTNKAGGSENSISPYCSERIRTR